MAIADGRATPPHTEHLIPLDKPGTWFSWSTFRQYVGPGWLMSLAFVDPGNIEADLQSGAFTGFTFGYILVLAHLAGFIVQSFASHIAVVSGEGLAGICRENYSVYTSRFLWLMAELAIIGSDVQEVIGTAIALNLLFGWPLWVGCLVTAGLTIVFLFAYLLHGIGLLEHAVLAVIGLIFACFATDFVASNPDVGQLLEGLFIPSLPHTKAETVQLVAMIGSVIMPHNLFLHSAIISKKSMLRDSPNQLKQSLKYFVLDAGSALLVSFLINLALQGAFAQGFFSANCAMNPSGPLGCDPSATVSVGCDLIDCACLTPSGVAGICTQIGLSNAGNALKSFLPQNATLLFGVGLLAAGQASTLSGTLAGQFVMEGFLEFRVSFWTRMFITRGIALIPALLVALLQSSFSGMNNLSQSLNVLQSVQLPFALIPLLHFCAQRSVMGEWVVASTWRLLGWTLAVGLIAVNGYIVYQQCTMWVAVVCGSAYLVFLIYLVTPQRDPSSGYVRIV